MAEFHKGGEFAHQRDHGTFLLNSAVNKYLLGVRLYPVVYPFVDAYNQVGLDRA